MIFLTHNASAWPNARPRADVERTVITRIRQRGRQGALEGPQKRTGNAANCPLTSDDREAVGGSHVGAAVGVYGL
jgi:hypothetical protein